MTKGKIATESEAETESELKIKIASVMALLLGATFVSASPAQALTQYSDFDSFTAGQPANFDIDYLTYQEFESDPGFHYFGVFTKGVITSSQFNDGLESWAMVRIDADMDGVADYRIETTYNDLEGNYSSPALVYPEGSREALDCSGQFYSDLELRVEWVGFVLDYECLELPKTFGVDAYMDYLGGDDFDYDYYPDFEGEFFIASHTFAGDGSSTATPSSSVSTNPPGLGTSRNGVVANPSQAPLALEKLSPEILESVVTIFCKDGLGTGWSADVNLSSAHSSLGMKSFIVTNEHVISDCTNSRSVSLVLNDGSRVGGTVVSWDVENDLAGIVTTASIPGLTWQGQTPAQGWWVGVLGAPRGISGYLTTGLISIITADQSELGTTSPVNPGNSGGPVFDREGRVIGTVSWKLLESEGLAFAKSAPLLCQQVVSCNGTNVWSSSPTQEAGSDSENGSQAAEETSERKLNAGSFKGYVALYAKGYKGERFSAKVGKDWVIRPALEEDFVRIVEFTGAGYTINVRMYINSELAKTITVTTK